jgi:hypothetical protein
MTTRSKSPLAGFGWLTRGISVAYRHPKPLFGGAALLLLACLLPSLVTLPMQFHSLQAGVQPNPATFAWIMAGSVLLGLLIVPLYAGYVQVIDAAERGLPVRARDIFRPYRQGEVLRLIGYALVILAIYIAMMAIIITASGGSIASWYMQVLVAQANHQPPPTALPGGFGIAIALATVFGLFMMGVYAISLCQVALRQRSVFAAIGDGMAGALKNLLPLLVFAVSLVVAWILVAIAVVLVALLLALLGKLVGAWLVFTLMVPLYILMMLTMFTMIFGVMYFLWRDVCGDDPTPGVAPSLAA